MQPTCLIDSIKVYHIIELTSQCCSVCGAKPSEIINIQLLAQTLLLTYDGLKYGFSTLHARICCMECVVHISYKLDIGKHQARSEEDKVFV